MYLARLIAALAALHVLSAYAETTSYVCRFPVSATKRGLNKLYEPYELRFVVNTWGKKAHLVSSNESVQVEVIPNQHGVTFLEITPTGNVTVTTISESGDATHSRSGMIMKELMPSQFYGKCTKQ